MTDEELKKACDDIDQFCLDIRQTLSTADLSDEDGISDMMRDVRIRVENIEGKAQRIRETLT